MRVKIKSHGDGPATGAEEGKKGLRGEIAFECHTVGHPLSWCDVSGQERNRAHIFSDDLGTLTTLGLHLHTNASLHCAADGWQEEEGTRESGGVHSSADIACAPGQTSTSNPMLGGGLLNPQSRPGGGQGGGGTGALHVREPKLVSRGQAPGGHAPVDAAPSAGGTKNWGRTGVGVAVSVPPSFAGGKGAQRPSSAEGAVGAMHRKNMKARMVPNVPG